MNNKQAVETLNKLFAEMDVDEMGMFAMRFFGPQGGTDFLSKNKPTLHGMSDAAIARTMEQFASKQIDIMQIPSSTAVLGVAAGLSLGLYLMAKMLGQDEALLEGSPTSVEEVREKFAKARERLKNESGEAQSLNDIDVSDLPIN
jgi:hypothetical protein